MSKYNYDGTYDEKTMILTGQGQVTAVPDSAVIRLGVETTGDNLMALQSENAQISQAVIDSIKNLGISDIKTFRYSIDKQYDYVNGTQIDRGYTVHNIVEIRLTDMEQVGRVIDTAVSYGANTVDFISFEVSDMKQYYQQALNQAVLSAIQKAESLAILLGLPLDPVPSRIEENSTPPTPFSRSNLAREGAFATPIEPGNKLIEAFVTVHFSY
jgi:uncharacterized protein YggE